MSVLVYIHCGCSYSYRWIVYTSREYAYGPILLERKAERIRRSMDTEKEPQRAVCTISVKIAPGRLSWPNRPFALFAQKPIVQLLGIYMAYLYGLLYRCIPAVNWNRLYYIALGIGLVGACQLSAITTDKVYIHLKSKNGGVGKPEFKLPAMVPGSLLLPIGCLIVSWTSEAHTHWIASDIGMALVGAGTILSFQCIQTYLLECFPLHAASAIAAVAFLSSLARFGFPLFAPAMYDALGFGRAILFWQSRQSSQAVLRPGYVGITGSGYGTAVSMRVDNPR